jgi:hypothetical protein
VEPAHLGRLMEKIRTAPMFNTNPNWGEFLDDEIIY